VVEASADCVVGVTLVGAVTLRFALTLARLNDGATGALVAAELTSAT
jgi:hypothetical protein